MSRQAPDAHSTGPSTAYRASSRIVSSDQEARGNTRWRKNAWESVERTRGKRRSE
jgi:hypothetical protein